MCPGIRTDPRPPALFYYGRIYASVNRVIIGTDDGLSPTCLGMVLPCVKQAPENIPNRLNSKW